MSLHENSLTAGQLKQLLEDVPDNTPIVVAGTKLFPQDPSVRGGSLVFICYASIEGQRGLLTFGDGVSDMNGRIIYDTEPMFMRVSVPKYDNAEDAAMHLQRELLSTELMSVAKRLEAKAVIDAFSQLTKGSEEGK